MNLTCEYELFPATTCTREINVNENLFRPLFPILFSVFFLWEESQVVMRYLWVGSLM